MTKGYGKFVAVVLGATVASCGVGSGEGKQAPGTTIATNTAADTPNVSMNSNRLIYVGTHPQTNAGQLTANDHGFPDHGSIQPFGFAIERPVDPIGNYLPLYMNTEDNKYRGTIYDRGVPESSGERIGFYSKVPIKGVEKRVVLYVSGRHCPAQDPKYPEGDSDVVLSSHFVDTNATFRGCTGKPTILGYILPNG